MSEKFIQLFILNPIIYIVYIFLPNSLKLKSMIKKRGGNDM